MKVFIFCLIIVYWSFGFSQIDSRGSKPSEIENPSGEKRALIVGVSNYLEKSLKLNYADNDAALFKNYLNQIEGIPNENIQLLLNENAAALGIVSALKKLYNNLNSGDHLYIYFAGHGDVVDDFGEQEGFLLAADANASQEYYSGGVLSLKLLNTIIKKLSENQVKVTLILDACRSGFLFEEGTHKNMGTIQAMFENSTKILSCGSNELSYESGELNHGYFTYFLVKGLSGEADTNTDNSIIYRELDDYLYNNVNNLVSKKLNQSQTPVIRTKNDRAQFKALKKENKIAFERLSGEVKSTKQVAARGIDLDLKKKDFDGIILDFKKAIQNQLYFGKSKAAYEIFKMASKKAELPKTYLDKMESTLLTTLSYEAQTLINAYINESTALPSTKEFNKQSKHLEICLELMGKDSFLYNRILASKLLLESYDTIKSKNYQKLRSAKSKLQTALKLEPRAAYIHNALGDIYTMERLYDSAFYQYNKAKKLIGSWSKPDKSLSDNFLNQYKYEEAKQLITNSLGTEGFDANLKLGAINTKHGKYALAEDHYKSALKLQPNNAQV
ncbi:MAG: caspase family protein, partial [Bacteroidota bacterium]